MTFHLLQSRDVSSARLRIEPNGLVAKSGLVSKSGIWTKLLALALCISYQANVPAEDKAARAIASSKCSLNTAPAATVSTVFTVYEQALSFSMCDRLHKSDEELLRSVLAGKHAMPYWQNKLSIDMFRSAIAYLRVMQQRYSSGLSPREEPIPEMHFKFNPVGEDEDYWQSRD